MNFQDLDLALEALAHYPEQSVGVLREAIAKAGSITRLAKATGIRRQTIAMWLRGAVVPMERTVRTTLEWLKSQQ